MSDMDLIMDVGRLPGVLDPAFYYSWVTDDKRIMSIAKMRGYVVVKASDPEGKALGVDDPRIRTDGVVGIGDAVLMRCPIDKVSQRNAERAKRNRMEVAAVKEEFHSAGAQLGVKTFEDTTPVGKP